MKTKSFEFFPNFSLELPEIDDGRNANEEEDPDFSDTKTNQDTRKRKSKFYFLQIFHFNRLYKEI